MDEGETEHNNLDFLLLSAVTVHPDLLLSHETGAHYGV